MLRVAHPATYLPERRYILDVLFGEFLGVPYIAEPCERHDVRVSMEGDATGAALTMPDLLFHTPQDSWLTAASLPKEPLARQPLPDFLAGTPGLGGDLPVVYGHAREGPCCRPEGDGLVITIDIPGSAFFMLTRYEEKVSSARDRHDRFPARASLAWREGFLERPLLNEYLQVLWSALARLWPGLQRKPRVHQVCLTCDVDRPLTVAGRSPLLVLRSMLADVLVRRDVALAGRRLLAWRQAQGGMLDGDPGNTFELIMEQSERRGLVSTFYFMACRSRHALDGVYSLGHPWIRRLMRRIHERGHELGLHASYRAYLDVRLTCREMENLRQVTAEEGIQQRRWGGRQHYLRWTNPTTWENCSAAGLDYDSTLGFAEHVGFRCGVCYEYPVFSLTARRPLPLREQPLIVMDATLDSAGLRGRQACDKVLQMNAVCKAFGGDFVLLWHSDRLISRQQRHWFRVIAESL